MGWLRIELTEAEQRIVQSERESGPVPIPVPPQKTWKNMPPTKPCFWTNN